MKKSILFVCLGNICRSPMAEEVFRQHVSKLSPGAWFVDSAGIGGWHEGQLPDIRMREAAKERDYTLTMRARQISRDDFNRFDFIVAMDEQNVADLRRLAPAGAENKILKLASFLKNHSSTTIPDPYYGSTQDFYYVIDLLEDAIPNLYAYLSKQ